MWRSSSGSSCYGLNMSCQNPHVEILKPNVMVWGGGVFGRCLFMRVEPLQMWTRAWEIQELPCFSYCVKNLHPQQRAPNWIPCQTSSFQICEKQISVVYKSLFCYSSSGTKAAAFECLWLSTFALLNHLPGTVFLHKPASDNRPPSMSCFHCGVSVLGKMSGKVAFGYDYSDYSINTFLQSYHDHIPVPPLPGRNHRFHSAWHLQHWSLLSQPPPHCALRSPPRITESSISLSPSALAPLTPEPGALKPLEWLMLSCLFPRQGAPA